MLSSLQVGLRALSPQAQAAHDRPGRPAPNAGGGGAGGVGGIPAGAGRGGGALVSHAPRPPLAAGAPAWEQALALRPPQTLRDLLQAHAGQTSYVVVETDSILLDLDTPQDYEKYRPATYFPIMENIDPSPLTPLPAGKGGKGGWDVLGQSPQNIPFRQNFPPPRGRGQGVGDAPRWEETSKPYFPLAFWHILCYCMGESPDNG